MMNQAPVSRALLVLTTATLWTGCFSLPSPSPPPKHIKMGSLYQTWQAPASHCEAGAQATAVTTPPSTAPAPSIVHDPDRQTLSVESRGAPVGRVLSDLAQRTNRTIVVRSDMGAHIPLYMISLHQPLEYLVSEIARSVGMRVLKRGDHLVVLDDTDAVHAERARIAATSPTKVETKVHTLKNVENAVPLGELISHHILSCQGKVISVPGESKLVIVDDTAHQALATNLLQALDRDTFTAKDLGNMLPRRQNHGVEDSNVPRCTPHTGTDTRTRVGDALFTLAQRQGKEFIAGCGGDRPLFLNVGKSTTLTELAKLAGLAPMQPGASNFATPEIAGGWTQVQPPEPQIMRLMLRDTAKLDAALINETHTHVKAMAWKDEPVLIVIGPPSALLSLEPFLKDFFQER